MKIRWNIAGFQAIRRSAGVDAHLQAEVDRIAARLPLGPDQYRHGVEAGKTRSRGFVVTATPEAMIDNAENHSLLRALGGGG